jgi:hypothetical protein
VPKGQDDDHRWRQVPRRALFGQRVRQVRHSDQLDLVLAAKGRAFRSLDTLTVRQGGHHLLYGSALALAAGGLAWARQTRAELAELTATVIR